MSKKIKSTIIPSTCISHDLMYAPFHELKAMVEQMRYYQTEEGRDMVRERFPSYPDEREFWESLTPIRLFGVTILESFDIAKKKGFHVDDSTTGADLLEQEFQAPHEEIAHYENTREPGFARKADKEAERLVDGGLDAISRFARRLF